MHKTFVDILLAESCKEGDNLNRLTSKAVYLLCWLKRYLPFLFSNWKMPEIGCFIHMGGCQNENEALFLRFLARLPVDVVILCPNRNVPCQLTDPLLYELNYEESLTMDRYPEESSQVKMGTVAYHAERELDTINVSGYRHVPESCSMERRTLSVCRPCTRRLRSCGIRN